MSYQEITSNIEAVEERIQAACQRAGRSRYDVTLIAVSKTKPSSMILQAIAAGLSHFGENRLEEASIKMPEVAELTEVTPYWHMIGHVQSRKAQDVVDLNFDLVHSLDSLKLGQRYDRFAGEKSTQLSVLLEMNVSGETAKHGWDAANWETDQQKRTQLWEEIESLLRLPNLHVAGLMTMAPFDVEPRIIREVFRSLASLRRELDKSFGGDSWQELSMGMTDDFEIAIEEGATLIRIGRAIFGERATK